MNKSSRRRRVPRSPFVVTFAVAAIGACGGTAFNGEGGSAAASGTAGSAGKSGSGTGAEGGAAGSGFGGSSAGTGGGPGGTGGGPGGTGGSPNCPTTMPVNGTPCATGEVCYYPSGPCCPPTEASCVNGQWMFAITTCNPPAPMCPLDPPVDGSPCTLPCGGYMPDCTYGYCSDGTPSLVAHCDGSVWRSSRAICPSQDGGAPCASQEQALRDYANAHKSCQLNTDCMDMYGPCADGADFCDGSYFVNHSIDPTTWQSLSNALLQCLTSSGAGCAICNAVPPPPACVNGTCGYGFATVDGGGV